MRLAVAGQSPRPSVLLLARDLADFRAADDAVTRARADNPYPKAPKTLCALTDKTD